MKNQNLLNRKKSSTGALFPVPSSTGWIIQKWLDLSVGDYFVLLNDHNPVRMREQFAAQWPGAFDWRYLQQGPDEFRIKITKLKATAPVGEVIESCGGH